MHMGSQMYVNRVRKLTTYSKIIANFCTKEMKTVSDHWTVYVHNYIL